MANEILYVPGVGTRYFYNKNTLGTVSLTEIGSSNWTSQLVDGHPCFTLSGTAFKFTTGSAFTGSHTVEYWINLDGWTNAGTTHLFGNSRYNNFYGVAPAVVSGGNNISLKLYFDFEGSGDQTTTVTLPSQSGWVHIAAVYEYSASNYKVNLYVNGTKVAEHYLQLMGSMRLLFGGSITDDSDTALNDAFVGKMANIIVTSGLKYTETFTPAWDEVDVSGLTEGGDKLRNFTTPEIEYLDAGNVPYKIAVETDDAMSTTSENPVQNKVAKAALDDLESALLNIVYPSGVADILSAHATPFMYRSNETASDFNLTIAPGTAIKIANGNSPVWFKTLDSAYTFNAKNVLDGSTWQAGKDYYVYVVVDGTSAAVKVSLNSTYPTGYTADNSRKIGGFHTLCAAVESGKTYIRNGVTKTHALAGYAAADILPRSVWCLNFRPLGQCEGHVYNPETDTWIGIYLQSGTGASTASVYGGTITDTRYPQAHQNDMLAVKCRLIDDGEFTSAAMGSNDGTNISGSADPGTTGGHTDTAGARMISNIGCEDCCGVLWQWLGGMSANGGSGWTSYGTRGNNDFGGSTYGTSYWPRGGGNWDDSANCGPFSRNANAGRGTLDGHSSARSASPCIRK